MSFLIDHVLERDELFGRTARLELRDQQAYLLGPMRGRPRFNFDAFARAARLFRARGLKVISPHELDAADGFNPDTDEPRSIKFYMRRDLAALLGCDFAVALPGWEESQGAQLEVAAAIWLGMPVYLAVPLLGGVKVPAAVSVSLAFSGPDDGIPAETTETPHTGSEGVPGTVLEEAIAVVDERAASYGHPLDHFTRTTGMLNALGHRKITPDGFMRELEPGDWPEVMICDKLAREQEREKRDTLVDIAGYARTKEKVRDEQARRRAA